MTITIGFIFLFILVVIPGFIFLRTYYFGDFSKQFTTIENVLNTLLSSMIPGLIIQSFCFLIYQKFIDSKLNLSSVFTLQKEIGSDGFNLSQITKTYLNRYDKFILYSLACYLLACLFGFLISRFIRFSQLDRQIKILRYKNHWYYLFSGEIFHFRKFKDAVEILDKPDLSTEKVIMTKADLLINSGNKNEKYSGYVIDYELDSKDPSKLDSIYLFDAHRYRVTELLEGDANVKTPLLKEKILVPGSVFHLSTRNLVNINISYIVGKHDAKVEQKHKDLTNKKRKKITNWILRIGLLLSLFIFIKIPLYKNENYLQLMNRISSLHKFMIYISYWQLINFFIPNKDINGYLSYKTNLKWKFIVTILITILFSIILYFI